MVEVVKTGFTHESPSNKSIDNLTHKYLVSVLDYDSDTGVFRWKQRYKNNTHLSGKIAGSVHVKGYLLIGVKGVRYLAHRLAWMYVNGAMPSMQIDHIDGNKTNNRISNLRNVRSCENTMNQKKANKVSTTGLLGVTPYKIKGIPTGRYSAQITLNYKCIHLGTYPTPELAHEAYLLKKRELHNTCTI